MKTLVTIIDEDGESTTRIGPSLHRAVLLTLMDHRTNYSVSTALHFIRMIAESAGFVDDELTSVEEISVLISLSRLAREFIEKHK